MQTLDISIVIVTHRNDDHFKNALASAQFAQNIFIIDNNSKNNWELLEKKYRFQVEAYPKKVVDFSQVRNSILEKITTEWVFFLDSDESIPKTAVPEIETIIKKNTFDAVAIPRIDYFLGKPFKYGEAGSLTLIRLFKVKKGKFVRSVHETVTVSGSIGTAQFVISHFSHDSIKTFLEKITQYAYLESKNKNTSKRETIVQMIIFPPAKFVFNYFFKLGFLDGYRGLIYAVVMSLHSFFVRVFRYESI